MPSGPATPRIYLIDAHSIIFQVFHAIRGMSSPSGLPTNALFGFTRDLLHLRRLQPDYLVCAFDRPEPTFRSDVYADYKAHREAMPADLQAQLPLIHRMLEAMNVPVVSHPRFEADDVLATIGRAAAAKGMEVFLCTSDKDCRQLIDDKVCLYNLRKGQVFGRDELKADWGVTPEQVVDLQTLVGDPVDNVPGVPGIGIKTAAKLLQEYGTLENLLANVDKIPGAKTKENLKAARDKLPMTRQLVRLATDVPVKLDWEAWRLREPDVPRLLELFRAWGFRSLGDEVRGLSPASAAAQGELFTNGEELFPFGANATKEAVNEPGQDGWQAKYELVDTSRKFESFLKKLEKQQRIAFDLETTSLKPLEADIVGLAFSWEAGSAFYLAVRGPAGSKLLDPETTLARLRPILENPAVAKINQNVKYDLLVLRRHGLVVQGVAGDSMVADYLLHAGERSHNLEDLARRYLNHQVIPITDLIGKKGRKQPQLRMDEVPTAKVAAYSGEDADVAWRLCALLEPMLEDSVERGPWSVERKEDLASRSPLHGPRSTVPAPRSRGSLRQLYDSVEVPLIGVLAELGFNGIRLDVPLLKRLSEEMARQLETIEKEIYDLAGHPFNIGSLPQLRKVLFEELKLPPQRKTGITGAASTDQESLEKLAALTHLPGHLLPRKILEHRQIAKLKSTYVDALPEMVNSATGRVHASFNQTVTSTGRLSSSDPNLQNVPVRREQGQQIRQAFLPAEGWVLLTADYSQIELRLLAHFSGDEALRKAFAEERDIHSLVAAQIFGVEEKDVTAGMRRLAKTVNFGVIYGMSGHGLAERLHIPRDEANRFIDAYFARYPKVLDYQARLLDQCRQTGYVSTILGRRRRIEGIRPNSTYQQRSQPEREAINMEIQGSAADLIKLAMLRLHERLKREKRQARMLLQIHDELVFETPPEELKEVAALVREEMTTPLEKELALEVPLRVDVAAGPNWLDVTSEW
jgi:DNA polymerase-1